MEAILKTGLRMVPNRMRYLVNDDKTFDNYPFWGLEKWGHSIQLYLMTQVFVYGTLRTGASNAFRMKGARSLGSATVKARLYRVHDQFPGIVLSEQLEEVLYGEVFTDVSQEHMEQLDCYEGCDAGLPQSEHIYHRVLTTATLSNGTQVEVAIWEYIRSVSESDRITSGDWLQCEA